MSYEEARRQYDDAELGGSFTLGLRPALLIVDFSCGFTDATQPLGANVDAEIEATNRLLDAARAKRLPVIFTTIGFEPGLGDAGRWLEKVPSLRAFRLGERTVEIDPRLEPRLDEPVVVKKGASAFFGTNLVALLTSRHVDTVVLCGVATSGCVRATAIDLLQHGYAALVPRECVADRARAPHEANLFDIGAKYANVVSLAEALAYLQSVQTMEGEAA